MSSSTQVCITLTPQEYEALVNLSAEDLRTPEDQVHFVVKSTLYERGALPMGPMAVTATTPPPRRTRKPPQET